MSFLIIEIKEKISQKLTKFLSSQGNNQIETNKFRNIYSITNG